MLIQNPVLYSYSDNKDIINCRVLIVDDERLIRNTLKKFVAKFAKEFSLNIEATDCENGFEGLDCVYRSHIDKKCIDIIFCDETMPYMKGSLMMNTICKSIKEEITSKMLMVSYTSYNDPDKVNYILSQGADMIKNKPFVINY